ncbi:MAG: hypothetical protein MZW92_53285 [Comamonadaceae bacterium]|nr:hypothetical protein [Comamonadaceae bacterium]
MTSGPSFVSVTLTGRDRPTRELPVEARRDSAANRRTLAGGIGCADRRARRHREEGEQGPRQTAPRNGPSAAGPASHGMDGRSSMVSVSGADALGGPTAGDARGR